MRVLVCGDRDWTDIGMIANELSKYPLGTVIIEGEARGADKIARAVAEELGFEVAKFPADWAKHHKAAGPIRNQQMLDEGKPDLVLAFHDNLMSSKGTLDMVKRARKASVIVDVFSHGEFGEVLST